MHLCGADTKHRQSNQEVAVGEFLRDAKTSWDTRFRQRGLQLDLRIAKGLSDRRFAVPANSLKQIADNLLSNMFRYASSDGPSTITAARGPSANSIEMEFRNAAPDVDQESLPFLFDRFFRVSESRTRQQHEHPTGLGLSIVKQLCLSYEGNASAMLDRQQLVINKDLPLSKHRSSFLWATHASDIASSS